MDAKLKFCLLLNSQNLNANHLARYALSGADYNELWQVSKNSLDIAEEIIGAKHLASIRALDKDAWCEYEEERAEKLGYRIVTIFDDNYPKSLHDLKDAPLVLYTRGNANLASEKKILAVVGTRKMSVEGKKIATMLGEMCAENDIILVSGGAAGVDGTAQSACLANGGEVFSVNGTGLDINFPAHHRELFSRIAEHGLVISEFPLGTPATKWRFPQRNRIISGLASRVIVVEAAIRSGSVITARLSMEQGREVWALPGSIFNENFVGTNKLIADGAHVFLSPTIFLESWGISSKKNALEKQYSSLTEEELLIYNFLSKNPDETLDNISANIMISSAKLLKSLTMLATRGVVTQSSPGRWSVK